MTTLHCLRLDVITGGPLALRGITQRVHLLYVATMMIIGCVDLPHLDMMLVRTMMTALTLPVATAHLLGVNRTTAETHLPTDTRLTRLDALGHLPAHLPVLEMTLIGHLHGKRKVSAIPCKLSQPSFC
jgi:hypothetical protein